MNDNLVFYVLACSLSVGFGYLVARNQYHYKIKRLVNISFTPQKADQIITYTINSYISAAGTVQKIVEVLIEQYIQDKEDLRKAIKEIGMAFAPMSKEKFLKGLEQETGAKIIRGS